MTAIQKNKEIVRPIEFNNSTPTLACYSPTRHACSQVPRWLQFRQHCRNAAWLQPPCRSFVPKPEQHLEKLRWKAFWWFFTHHLNVIGSQFYGYDVWGRKEEEKESLSLSLYVSLLLKKKSKGPDRPILSSCNPIHPNRLSTILPNTRHTPFSVV